MFKELSATGKALFRAHLGADKYSDSFASDAVIAEIHRVRQLGRCKTSLGGVWSPVQEKQLVAAVSECGEEWDKVCVKVAGHSGVECKQKWHDLTQKCRAMRHVGKSKLTTRLTGSLYKGLSSSRASSAMGNSASSSEFVTASSDGEILMVINKVVNCPTPKQMHARRVRCFVRLDVEGYRFDTKVERRGGITEDGQVVDFRNVVQLPEGISAETKMHFKVVLKHRVLQDEVVGRVEVKAGVLFQRKERRLVLLDEDEYIVMHKSRPVMLEVRLVASSLPETWPLPTPSRASRRNALTEQYPRHVMMLTRGTRGDVQPFLALARGLAGKGLVFMVSGL